MARHENINERRRATKDVERTCNFLETVIENVPTTKASAEPVGNLRRGHHVLRIAVNLLLPSGIG